MKEKKLIIIKDTRESNRDIYLFTRYPNVLLLRNNLTCGDFSIAGYTNQIFVERKTTDDLCGSFTANRERFEDEWRRAETTRYTTKFLMIEGNLADILNAKYCSQIHPHSLIASILSWSIKYSFNWFTVPNERAGEQCLYWLFKNYLRLAEEGTCTQKWQ